MSLQIVRVLEGFATLMTPVQLPINDNTATRLAHIYFGRNSNLYFNHVKLMRKNNLLQ